MNIYIIHIIIMFIIIIINIDIVYEIKNIKNKLNNINDILCDIIDKLNICSSNLFDILSKTRKYNNSIDKMSCTIIDYIKDYTKKNETSFNNIIKLFNIKHIDKNELTNEPEPIKYNEKINNTNIKENSIKNDINTYTKKINNL